MAELHYFPLYASDWLAGEATTRMTPEQEGAFFRLLVHSWLSTGVPCSIPADDAALAEMSKLRKRWFKVGGYIREQFEPVEDAPDRIRNHKLWTIYVEQTEKHGRRVLAGALGGHARAKRKQSASKPIANLKQSSSNAIAMLENDPSNARAMLKQSESESDIEKLQRQKPVRTASVEAGKKPSELLSFDDCESLRQKWERTGRSCEYARFRKTLKPLFIPMKRFTIEQLSGAIEAFDELARSEGPTKSSFWHIQRFVDNIGQYVEWAEMPAVDPQTNQLTARGRMAMQGAA